MMTSAEAGPLADAEPEDEATAAVAVEGAETLWEIPWAPNDDRRRNGGRPGSSPAVPAGNTVPQNGAPAPPGAVPGPGARAPGAATPAPGTTGPPTTSPGTPAGPAATAPPAAAAPAPAAPPPDQRPEEHKEPENGGLPVDPEMLSTMAPMALMAGSALLPILGSALSGLLGGGSGGGQPAEGQMSPEAQKALEALDLLAEVYGDGPTDDPQVKKLREELGLNEDGSDSSDGSSGSGSSGETARMVKARQLFQKNAAKAFNNLDNQLANYIKRLAGNNSVDKKAVTALIREVNVALAELGPEAYTKEGQQKVREILTRALKKAHGIVAGGQANADDTAASINKLTNQYLYNLAGQDVPKGYMSQGGTALGAGGSAAARRAVEVALAQQGDPYVWGAEGPNNFDCSGLTQYAAKAAGVNIPRVAADQYRSLPKVPPGQIQPGDLVFPSSSFKSGGPGHVMMYIGDGKVVHAPRTGDVVRVAALPSSYEAARWA